MTTPAAAAPADNSAAAEPTPNPGPLRQSFSWWSFSRGVTEPATLLNAAKRIGYDAVDLLPEEIWPAARDAGLNLAAISGHRPLNIGFNDRANHERLLDSMRATIQKAVEWKVPTVLCFPGNRNGISDDEGADAMIEALRILAPVAEQAGVNLVIELLNSLVDHKDYMADSTAWGVRVCEAVGSPRVGLLYDIYHMQINEGNVIATIRKHHRHFLHYHTAGVPGRRDLDDEQELYYPAIVRAILRTGYTGYLAHEFSPKGDAVAALEAAYRTCNVTIS